MLMLIDVEEPQTFLFSLYYLTSQSLDFLWIWKFFVKEENLCICYFSLLRKEKKMLRNSTTYFTTFTELLYIYFCLCKACTGKRNAIGKFPSKSMPRRGAETCSIIQAAMTSEVCVSVIFLGSCDVIFGWSESLWWKSYQSGQAKVNSHTHILRSFLAIEIIQPFQYLKEKQDSPRLFYLHFPLLQHDSFW